MESTIWSRLPLEVLVLVVTSTSDPETLISWCDATFEGSTIHQVALRQRWKSVKIDERDIIPAPGDDYRLFQQKERKLRKLNLSWKPAGKEVLELTKPLGNGVLPATYVQDIVFDFRMSRFFRRDLSTRIDKWTVMPSGESFEHTLSILKPTIVNVRRIQAFGLVPEGLLDLFLGSTVVQSLSIRTREGAGVFYYERLTAEGPSTILSLRLEALARLEQLQDLDIHGLLRDEAPRLATAIPKLTKLQRLVVADKQDEHSERYVGVVEPCPMEIFIGKLLAREDLDLTCDRNEILPSTLKSLTLIDDSWDKYETCQNRCLLVLIFLLVFLFRAGGLHYQTFLT